jgi:hypothetical protein
VLIFAGGNALAHALTKRTRLRLAWAKLARKSDGILQQVPNREQWLQVSEPDNLAIDSLAESVQWQTLPQKCRSGDSDNAENDCELCDSVATIQRNMDDPLEEIHKQPLKLIPQKLTLRQPAVKSRAANCRELQTEKGATNPV